MIFLPEFYRAMQERRDLSAEYEEERLKRMNSNNSRRNRR
jgi:hypothetical protein